MPLLYYWRPDNYFRDLDMGVGYHLNQANKILHNIEIGESLWAFTRNRVGCYVLAAELIIKSKTINPPNYRYGRYRVWGDIHSSRYFQVINQPSIEQIVRSFSIKTNADYLGQSFQGNSAVRVITKNEDVILKAFARDLPLEPRAHIFSEEKLEASLILGDPVGVEKLLVEEAPGIAQSRLEYLYKQAPNRNPKFLGELRKIYQGRCQICLWDPIDQYHNHLCQAHHIRWLSRGGEDEVSNIVLICPNHHAAIHRMDAPLDFSDLAFDFGDHREKIILNSHISK